MSGKCESVSTHLRAPSSSRKQVVLWRRWFATPVDAMEDAASFTVVFHARLQQDREVVVTATEGRLLLAGPRVRKRRRATRVCVFPCPIVENEIRTVRSGDLLRVRVPKRRTPAAPDTNHS